MGVERSSSTQTLLIRLYLRNTTDTTTRRLINGHFISAINLYFPLIIPFPELRDLEDFRNTPPTHTHTLPAELLHYKNHQNYSSAPFFFQFTFLSLSSCNSCVFFFLFIGPMEPLRCSCIYSCLSASDGRHGQG